VPRALTRAMCRRLLARKSDAACPILTYLANMVWMPGLKQLHLGGWEERRMTLSSAVLARDGPHLLGGVGLSIAVTSRLSRKV
jgi:hypothetical protein